MKARVQCGSGLYAQYQQQCNLEESRRKEALAVAKEGKVTASVAVLKTLVEEKLLMGNIAEQTRAEIMSAVEESFAKLAESK